MAIATIEHAGRIREGAMGVGITDAFMARTITLHGGRGMTSIEGASHMVTRTLEDGDPMGTVRRVIDEFEERFDAPRLAKLARSYFIEGGKSPNQPYKDLPMFNTHPSWRIEALSILGGYFITRTAKVGNFLKGPEVEIEANKLEKVQGPIPSVVFGAMLAGVDGIEISAGLPFQMRAMMNALCGLESVRYNLDIRRGKGPREGRKADYYVPFNPRNHIGRSDGPLKPPKITAVASSNVAARVLTDQSRHPNAIDQLKVEQGEYTGGHTPKPRVIKYQDNNEYQYGPKDDVDLSLARRLTSDNGILLTVAGGVSSPEAVQHIIQEIGADSVTVATIFQYCRESGLEKSRREAIVRAFLNGDAKIFSDPRISPTDYAYRTVSGVKDIQSIGDQEVYAEWSRTVPARNKIGKRSVHKACTNGALRTGVINGEGHLIWMCKSEPEQNYDEKGGDEKATHGSGCACEMLMEPIGLGQIRKDGYRLPGLYSSGTEVGFLRDNRLMRGRTSYSARDVIQYLTSMLR